MLAKGGEKEKEKEKEKDGATDQLDKADKPAAGAKKEREASKGDKPAPKDKAGAKPKEKKGGDEDGHDIVNIAPLGKREKKDRESQEGSGKSADGAPEATTAST